jgi:hypothetical protein
MRVVSAVAPLQINHPSSATHTALRGSPARIKPKPNPNPNPKTQKPSQSNAPTINSGRPTAVGQFVDEEPGEVEAHDGEASEGVSEPCIAGVP